VRFQVSWPTAKRQPNRTPQQPLVHKIVHLRCKRRLGLVAITDR